MPCTSMSRPRNGAHSETVRYPCPMVLPNGPFLARSTSTWIHWWSSVASANWLIRSCVIVSQSVVPRSVPAAVSSASGDANRVAIQPFYHRGNSGARPPVGAHHDDFPARAGTRGTGSEAHSGISGRRGRRRHHHTDVG